MVFDDLFEAVIGAFGAVVDAILTPIVTAVLIHGLTVAGIVYSLPISLFFGGFVSFWMTVGMLIRDENPYDNDFKNQVTILLYYTTGPMNVIGWLLFVMGG
jgi:hypothetical protein